MPSFNCRHPTCTAILPRPGWCGQHQPQAAKAEADRQRRYDQVKRDLEAKRFYDSARWKRARKRKLAETPWCQACKREWAVDVHHDKPLSACTEPEKTDQKNLVAVCKSCHSTIEGRRRGAGCT